jgi:hypothetical protein
MGRSGAPVKDFMGQGRERSDDAIKGRLVDGLHGRTMQWLAEETGEPYKSVRRYLGSGTEHSTTPAHFVARYVSVVPVNALWVLTGEGPIHRVSPREEAKAVALIARTVHALEEGRPIPDIPASLFEMLEPTED